MSRRALLYICAIGMLLFGPAPATAGGVSVRSLTLVQLLDKDGFAAVVKPESMARAKLTATVLKCFNGRPRSESCKEGARQTFQLADLPQPLHPQKTYLTQRYWGPCRYCLGPNTPKVILIATLFHFEPLKHNAKNLRLARLVGRPAWKAAYIKETPLSQLQKDLGNPDLFQLAYKELARKRRLTFKSLLSAARKIDALPHDESFNLLLHHLKQQGTGRQAFIDQIVAAYISDRHPRVLQALRRCMRQIKLEGISSVRRLLVALRFKDPKERWLMMRVLVTIRPLVQSAGAQKYRKEIVSMCTELLKREAPIKRLATRICQKYHKQ